MLLHLSAERGHLFLIFEVMVEMKKEHTSWQMSLSVKWEQGRSVLK